MQIAFYGSTPAYASVFETHGFTGVPERLHALQRAGDIVAMAEAITDEMLDVYAVTSTWEELPHELVRKYGGIASRLIFYFADPALDKGPETMAKWKRAITRTKELAAA